MRNNFGVGTIERAMDELGDVKIVVDAKIKLKPMSSRRLQITLQPAVLKWGAGAGAH